VTRARRRTAAARGAIAFVAVTLLAGGCGRDDPAWSGVTASATTATAAPATIDPPPATTTAPYSAVPERSATLDALGADAFVAPVAVRVEDVELSAPVVPVSADADDGELAVPPTPDAVAWYEHGATPGAGGSAVLAAHVDWNGARGAFFALSAAAVGADVTVAMADGRDLHFVVRSIEQVKKADLPLDRIFARDGPPRLVLITCGGDFDRGRREYADNVVVFADLLGS
jgi:sortase (surface protein transpeptidase)